MEAAFKIGSNKKLRKKKKIFHQIILKNQKLTLNLCMTLYLTSIRRNKKYLRTSWPPESNFFSEKFIVSPTRTGINYMNLYLELWGSSFPKSRWSACEESWEKNDRPIKFFLLTKRFPIPFLIIFVLCNYIIILIRLISCANHLSLIVNLLHRI